jgi:predicted CxxxxCH...CXXCH cytochrome family protein
MRKRSIAAATMGLGGAIVVALAACEVNILTEVPSGPGWGPGSGDDGQGGGAAAGGARPYPDCHGTADDPAPPPDRNQISDPTTPSVGAHQQHFHAYPWHLTVACEECHMVPTTAGKDPNVPTHLNDLSDMDFGPLAGAASYDTETHVCSNVYCHGATLPPDDPALGVVTIRQPVWNQVDGTQAACGTACHTNPPIDLNHAAADIDCERSGCHSGELSLYNTANPNASLWLRPELHINGLPNAD